MASSDDWVVVDYPEAEYGKRLKQPHQLGDRSHALEDLSYQPLDFPSWETRFIRLHDTEGGNSDAGPVCCDMFHGSLINAPKDYVALSYCWGDHKVTRSIYVNGIMRKVTTNLEAALRALRRSGIRLVWIDAICINQSDNYERSYQVSRMGAIYSQASKVVVWLGNTEDNSDKAMRLLSSLSSRRVPEAERESIYGARRPVAGLLMRSYWQRVWIVQELAKASSIEVWCGQDKLEWKTFVENSKNFKNWYGGNFDCAKLDNLQYFRQIEQQSKRGAPRMLLSQALVRTRYTRATDMRDKVYALLALTRDGAQVVPTPNYAQDVIEVFKAVSRDMIVTQGQTALILLAGLRNNPPCSPSWIPLWFSEDAQLPPWIVDCVNKHETQFEPKTHAEDGRLSVPGFMLENIAKAEVDPMDLSNSANTKPKIKSTSETVGVICEISSFLVSCNDSQDVLSRTVEVTRAHALVALWLSAREVLPPQLPLLRRWYDEHKHWPVQSRPIVEWVEGHNRLSRQASWYSSTESIDVLKPLEVSLRLMEQHNMRMVLTDRTGFRGSLRMAHRASAKGDFIYRLENCALPVVLRPNLDGTFTIVGEALGRRDGKNNNWQAHIGWIESGFKHWRTITLV